MLPVPSEQILFSPWICEDGSRRLKWRETQTSCCLTELKAWPPQPLLWSMSFPGDPLPASSKFWGGKDFDLVTLPTPPRSVTSDKKKGKVSPGGLACRLCISCFKNRSFLASVSGDVSVIHSDLLQKLNAIWVFPTICLLTSGFTELLNHE